MTIETNNPELEALIEERFKSSSFQSIEEMLLDALRSAPETQLLNPELPLQRKTLAQLFAESPFRGLALDFERLK